MTETTVTVPGIFSLSSPNKRKRSDTEIMSHLRAEAAKVVKKRLGHDPKKVTISCKPFPKRKTIYIWKVIGDLTEEEEYLVARTINSESEQRRYFRSWSYHEKVQITSLIKKGAILPEYYDNNKNQTDSQSAAWELLPSDTDNDDGVVDDEDSVDYQSKDGLDDQSLESAMEPTAKRLRGASVGNRSKGSPEAVVQTEGDSVPETPQPKVTSIAIQTASSTQIARRCSLRHSQSSNQQVISPGTETTSKPQVPKLSTPTPPRTMSLNSQGILELDPMPTTANPSPTFPVAAPIAASPLTPTAIDPPTPSAEQNGADSDQEKEKNVEKIKIALMDMENQMRAWMSHATNGYLAVPKLWSENRALKRQCEEKERQFSEQTGLAVEQTSILKQELEEKTKLILDKESLWKEKILSLETRHIEEKLKLEKEIEDLRQNANSQKEEQDNRISTLEQELSECRTSEKNLRHKESVMKDCYQRLGAEHDKLKEATDLDAKKSKETIDALEKTRSELEERLKASAETYASKEVAFGDTIMSLELKLYNSMAEKELIHNSLLEKDSLKLLENVMKYQRENNPAPS
ncbi:hypothetical protein TWF481_001718 [Arthrobotrys musiformis]|uniref:Uncharacterized protein n=1 Tax=Arthrobotrys musiformis TaxID=47236 RepID=A0AAV9VU40_9PEZI